MDINLQGFRNKKRHDKKQGQRTNELEMESSQTIARSVGGLASQTVQGISYDN